MEKWITSLKLTEKEMLCSITRRAKMNTKQISTILNQNHHTSRVFYGIFPRNKLPRTKLKDYPSAFVANVDPDTKPGSHWVAFYFQDKQHGEYFDSYGRAPEVDAFKQFLERNCLTWTYNHHRLQGPITSVCGQYVLYYLLHRCLGHSMADITNNFTEDHDVNDNFVNDFIHKSVGLDLPLHDRDFLTSQISSSFVNSI